MAIPSWHTAGINAILASFAKEKPSLSPKERSTVSVTEKVSYTLYRSSDPSDKDLYARVHCKGKMSSSPLVFTGMFKGEDK